MLPTDKPVFFFLQNAGMNAPLFDLPGRCFLVFLGASRLSGPSHSQLTDVPFPLYSNFSGGGRGLFSSSKSSSSTESLSPRSPASVVRLAVVAVLSTSSIPSSRTPLTVFPPSIFPTFIPYTRGYIHASLSCAYGDVP